MGPLTGTSVIEIAGIGPGPFAAMMLADMGADVIRVDRVRRRDRRRPGQRRRSTSLNRGRRSIGVDLKKPDGVETVLRLVESADALHRGLPARGRPSASGLGPDDCLARNPKLVYGRMTGWGQEGPYAHGRRPRHQLHRPGRRARPIGRAGARPRRRRSTWWATSAAAACYLAFGVVCAMFEAQRSGEGQVVDAAMVDGAASLMNDVLGHAGDGHLA